MLKDGNLKLENNRRVKLPSLSAGRIAICRSLHDAFNSGSSVQRAATILDVMICLIRRSL
jgi:hypothetical protein